jgi:membrane protein YqaA with SNARE-associated domain
MALISKFYTQIVKWAGHRHAPYYLTGVCIAESAVLPFPPEILLAPMTIAKPHFSVRFAFLATIGSVIGAMLGYLIGEFAYELIAQPIIDYFNLATQFEEVDILFENYGMWIIFIAAFIPLPFKLCTITAGMTQMAFPPFILAALLGRGLRFNLVALLSRYGGHIIEKKLIKFLDKIELLLLIIVILAVLVYFIVRH